MQLRPNSNGASETGLTAAEEELRERWSDEARAAALAARRAKSAGRDWRFAARDAFHAMTPRHRRDALRAGAPAVGHEGRERGLYDKSGAFIDRHERDARADRVKRADTRRKGDSGFGRTGGFSQGERRVAGVSQSRRAARFQDTDTPPLENEDYFRWGAFGTAGHIPIPKGAKPRKREPWED